MSALAKISGVTGPARRRRLLIAAVVGGLAVGAVPALNSTASAVPSSGDPSLCRVWSLNAAIVYGDPAALYTTIAGYYQKAEGVAYKITGQFRTPRPCRSPLTTT
jgi:hypothetical protein